MAELGFEEISTMECLVRNYDVRTINLPNPDFSKENKKSQPHRKNKKPDEEETMDTTPLNETSEETPQSEEVDSCNSKDKQISEELDTPAWDYIGKKTAANFSFKAGISLGRMPGHTGYLTFATLYPI